MRRLVSNERRELTGAPAEPTSFRNQPAAQKTAAGVSGRYLQKGDVARDIPLKNTKTVATWQRWEKIALDRKFMIVISILAILSLGTAVAIVDLTHRLLAHGQKTGDTRALVEDSKPTQEATVTLKLDGSHFSGTVVRRKNNSITVSGPGGFVRTFLESELSDIKYAPSNSPLDSPGGYHKGGSPGTSDKPAAAAAPSAVDRVIEFAKGAEFPIRSVGFLDSSSISPGAIFVGVTDADIKSRDGKVLIPQGANVTFGLLDNKKIDGHISMSFELDSADFDGRHYVVLPAAGKLGPGITAAFAGAKEGSPEARERGLNVHLDDQYYMEFRAAVPVTFRLSKK